MKQQPIAAYCKITLDQPWHPGRGNPEGEEGKRTKQEREGRGGRGEEVEKRGWKGKEEGRKKEGRRVGGRVGKEKGGGGGGGGENMLELVNLSKSVRTWLQGGG